MPDLDRETSRPLDIGRCKEWNNSKGNLRNVEECNNGMCVPNPLLYRTVEGYLAILLSAATPLVPNGRLGFDQTDVKASRILTSQACMRSHLAQVVQNAVRCAPLPPHRGRLVGQAHMITS